MEIQTAERCIGIPFDSPKQAFNAILLYLADFHNHAKYVGPELFSSWSSLDFLNYDLVRLNGFIERLEKNSEAYGNYGSHIGSPISSLQLHIGKSPDGKSILSIILNLDNDEDYESRIIELLNEPAIKNHLEPHFTNRDYRRIQQSASINVVGNVQDSNRAREVLQGMGFKRVSSRMGDYWETRFQQFTLPASETQEKALAIPYEVEIHISDIFNGVGMNVYHPESYKHAYYEGPHLTHARNTLKKSLESLLQK